jgi:hypothetical protein
MTTTTTKDKVLEAVRQLPSDATVEDAIERLHFLAKVLRGLEEADSDQGVPHEEVKRRLSGG